MLLSYGDNYIFKFKFKCSDSINLFIGRQKVSGRQMDDGYHTGYWENLSNSPDTRYPDITDAASSAVGAGSGWNPGNNPGNRQVQDPVDEYFDGVIKEIKDDGNTKLLG